jgi:LPPG:FO 2-phospho-L-lactate transferase
MSDGQVETHVRLARETTEHSAGELIHFEEWWVRYRAGVPVTEFIQVGLDEASATPEVIEAITSADVIIIPPSNPVVSVGTILAVPGVRDALRSTAAPVVGLSPIIGGAAVRGMAEKCLATIGVDTTALGVAGLYGARSRGGVLDGWLMDNADAEYLPALEDFGIRGSAAPLWMTDIQTTAAIASEALAIASSVSPPAHL